MSGKEEKKIHKVPISAYFDDVKRDADAAIDAQRKRGRPSKADLAARAAEEDSSSSSSSSSSSKAVVPASKSDVFIKLKIDEDFTKPLTAEQKLLVLAHPMDEISRLRGLLAKMYATIQALQNGEKRPYNAASQTIPITEFVCQYLRPLVTGKTANQYLFEGERKLGSHISGRTEKKYKGPREYVCYGTALKYLQEECARLNMKGRIGWHSFRKAFGAWPSGSSGQGSRAICAKLLNQQDTSCLLAYLRIEDGETDAAVPWRSVLPLWCGGQVR